MKLTLTPSHPYGANSGRENKKTKEMGEGEGVRRRVKIMGEGEPKFYKPIFF